MLRLVVTARSIPKTDLQWLASQLSSESISFSSKRKPQPRSSQTVEEERCAETRVAYASDFALQRHTARSIYHFWACCPVFLATNRPRDSGCQEQWGGVEKVWPKGRYPNQLRFRDRQGSLQFRDVPAD